MQFINRTEEQTVKKFVRERFRGTDKEFREAWSKYVQLKPFKISENVFESCENSDTCYNQDVQTIVRLVTQYYLTKSFKAMKIDLTDPNVYEDNDTGNISTPGRIAKMWVGSSLNDTSELMSGRWIKEPRIATFPNTSNTKIPITKRVTINAVCSHHAAIFSTLWSPESYAIVSYIPDKYVLGISKLSRVVENYIGRRGWLQEDLTNEIYRKLTEIAQTDSVYVKLVNVIHSCELNRGAKDPGSGFTTEKFGGLFNEQQYRDMVNKDY